MHAVFCLLFIFSFVNDLTFCFRCIRIRIPQIKDESQREQYAVDQAIEAAALEVTTANQQVEQQVAVRKKLEESIRELERNLNVEAEAKTARQDWEKETNQLLDSIQKDCNLVFDRNKAHTVPSSNTKSTSPRTVFADFAEDEIRVVESGLQFQSPWPTSKMIHTGLSSVRTEALVSPLSHNISELDRALDETEAIVRSLVSSDYKGFA